jgi:hypothetical protein
MVDRAGQRRFSEQGFGGGNKKLTAKSDTARTHLNTRFVKISPLTYRRRERGR